MTTPDHSAIPPVSTQVSETEAMNQSDINSTLAERGKRYGEFREHARITQNIKRAMVDSRNWNHLSDDKKETLEMIAHKVGRILNGDPEYSDSWHDIVGYTVLVEKEIIRKEQINKVMDGQDFLGEP